MSPPRRRSREASSALPYGDAAKHTQPTLQDKVHIMNWHNANGKIQSKTVAHFHTHGFPKLSQSSLSRWLKVEQWYYDCLANGDPPSKKKFRPVHNAAFEEMLCAWINRIEEQLFNGLTGDAIKLMASKVYDALGTPVSDRLKLSNGWLDKFKWRHSLKSIHFHREAASASSSEVQNDRQRISTLLNSAFQDGYSLDDIYNMDETSFFYAATPESGIARHVRPGKKQLKVRLTLALTVNASGSDQCEPLFIGKSKAPRCFQKKTPVQLDLKYFNNQKAWMTGAIFQHWVGEWDARLRCEGRKIILFVDNFKGHKLDGVQLTNIQLEYFGPNLTAHVQPCDAGIIRTFKAIYRRLFVLRVIDTLVTDNVDISTIFEIDQLSAMRLAKQAWISISESTIINCWKHTKILPQADDCILQEVPSEEDETLTLQDALDVLQRQLPTCTLLPAHEFIAQEDTTIDLHLAHVELDEILREYFNVDTERDATVDAAVDVRDQLVRNTKQSAITDFFRSTTNQM